METVAPYKEIIDVIKASGGDAFKRCFQCGLCDTCLSLEQGHNLQHAQDRPRSDVRFDRDRK